MYYLQKKKVNPSDIYYKITNHKLGMWNIQSLTNKIQIQ